MNYPTFPAPNRSPHWGLQPASRPRMPGRLCKIQRPTGAASSRLWWSQAALFTRDLEKDVTMDLLCTTCGEPWDLDHVLHEEPEAFTRAGAAIVTCPCCENSEHGKNLRQKDRERLSAARELGKLLGDDVDGYAAELQDMGLTT